MSRRNFDRQCSYGVQTQTPSSSVRPSGWDLKDRAMGACDECGALCVIYQQYFGTPRSNNTGDIWPHVGPFGCRCEQQNERKVSVIYGPVKFWPLLVIAIKQIRGFVGLILQPEMEPPKIVPDPRINTERDESSQSHLTVSTTCRSFRDKPTGKNYMYPTKQF